MISFMDITDFEVIVLQKYTVESEYRSYLHHYYTLFGFSLLEAMYKDRVHVPTEHETINSLYIDIFDALMANNGKDFITLNDSFLKEAKRIIRIRYGDHSDEYRYVRDRSMTLAIIFTQVEKLRPRERIALKISFVNVVGSLLNELYDEIKADENRAEKMVLSKLVHAKDPAASLLFLNICEQKRYLKERRKPSNL